jgi:hypothetical protein
VSRYLVEQGADGSYLDNEGNSALVRLLMRNDAKEDTILPVAKRLLDSGARPLQSNNEGKSARSIAKVKGFHHITTLVKEYELNPRRVPAFQYEPEEEEPAWVISHADICRTSPLAEDGFGTVYLAKWAHTEVVVKEISVVEMRRFLREMTTWRRFTHDNVVPFYGANHRKEPFFIVSKYASNGELVPYLKREKAR